MSNLPLISIVTPSFNQAPFLEQAIRSVLDQNYPGLEYIVIDGGSTDGSIDIIRKYEDRLAYWVSEPDRGQAHALNKGFLRATGEIVGWINSDDFYLPGAFKEAAGYFAKHPDVALFCGACEVIDEQARRIKVIKQAAFSLVRLVMSNSVAQPAAFFRRSVLDQVGLLDESLHYAFDYEFWLRIAVNLPVGASNVILAAFREHPESKTCSQPLEFTREISVIRRSRAVAECAAAGPSQRARYREITDCYKTQLHFFLKELKHSKGFWKRTLQMLIWIQRLLADTSLQTPREHVVTHFTRGVAAMRSRRWGDARWYFKYAAALAPWNGVIFVFLGVATIIRGGQKIIGRA